MDRDELLTEVKIFRSALQDLVRSGFFFQISINKRFPSGCCDDASALLATYLKEKGFPGALRISGAGGGYRGELCSHIWLRLEQFQIDITGSQFEEYNQPEILIAEQDDFLDTFELADDPEIADFREKFADDPLFRGYFSQAYEALSSHLPASSAVQLYGVSRVTGMELDQGGAMKPNDEFKPKCPGCKSDVSNFCATQVIVDHADKPIALLSCVGCGHVIGAFPENAHQTPVIEANVASAKSFCCGSEKFVAYLDRYSPGLKDQPALILCGECENTVIATLPATGVWNDI